MDRRIIGIFILVGSTVGSFVPEVWGGSVLGVASLAFGALGAILGLWLGLQLAG